MFGKKAAKKAQQEAEKKAAAAEQSIAQAAQPTPLQSAWEKANLDFLNWENREGAYKDKPLNVFDAPGMHASIGQYRRAKEGQVNQRQGIGALRLGLSSASPEYAANLAEQTQLHREQDAAGALEEALARKTAEAHGSVMPLAQLNTSRALGIADLRTGLYRHGQNRADQLQANSGLWTRFSPLIMQGVKTGASLAGGGGGAEGFY